MDVERNPTMCGGNRCTRAVFGANCSNGRAVTTVPERWPNTFTPAARNGSRSSSASGQRTRRLITPAAPTG
jgi:hypothetical protein